ncbi:MAG: hypothetical protein ACQEWV_03210 [Bacillota bacterium]
MMKAKIIILFILLSTLLILTIYLTVPLEKLETKQPRNEEETIESYKTLTYIITKVSGNDYYGQSIDGKTKIYFSSENVKYPITDTINVDDKILAYVEPENHVDGLVKIEKMD